MTKNTAAIANASDTLKFLTELFHSSTSGYAVIWSDFNVDVFAFRNDELEKVANKLQELSKRGDTYVGRGLQGSKPGPRSRGKQDTVVFVSHLMLDVDTREGPHGPPENPADPLTMPENLDETLEIISDIGCPDPTMIVRTGGGYHLYWVYAKAEMIITEQQRKAEKKFSQQFQIAVRRGFQKVGYKLDGTADLSRMCKAPGTFNHKTSPAKAVSLAKISERICRSVIQKWLDCQFSSATTALVAIDTTHSVALIARIAYTESMRTKKSTGVSEDLLSPIIAGCSFIEHAIVNASRLSEPEWHAMVGIVCRTALGHDWAHDCSKAYPGYSIEETNTKIEHALADAGPATCEHIADRIGFDGCGRCPFRASIRSPINLAKQPLQIVKAQKEHIYIVKGQMYLDLNTGDTLKISEFADSIQHLIGEGPHSRMMSSVTTPKVRLAEYRAGDDRLIFYGSLGLVANLWKKGGVDSKQGDFEIISRYLQRFIPDNDSRLHIIQYIAHLLQFPATKITHGVIITGDQGTGKSSLYLIMEKLFGSENARKLEGEELGSKFNTRLVNTQILLVEEAQHGERLETYEKLKEIITAETFSAERKHYDVAPGYTPRGTFISSNHLSPIALPQNERRWFVARSCDRPEIPDEVAAHNSFFEELHDALQKNDDAISAFSHYLQNLDLANFKPNAAPPVTVAKEVATENSRTPLANILNELISSGNYPLHKDVVSMGNLQYAITMSEWSTTNVTPQKLAQALRSLGLKQVNMDSDGKHLELVLPDRSKVRPWAIRNVAQWVLADREALKSEFMRSDTAVFLYNQDEDKALIKLNVG
ncbi:primase-helicase family protein [Methylobacterium sp. E-066]|uniref:primase-helicase family protein n=1 Tax=Methylobacterium sp. E-066 TaxID=2836584 RepID=UPI001FB8C02F|nr:primase-helicase family protein [Methylobacterium sp. E-066]MCJ2139973.1 DUF5906 domain-containing protein [Methylobacterium sp. E-066]